MKKIAIISALLCAIVQGAWAANTPFVQCSWNETTKSVEKTTVTDKAAIVLPRNDGEWVNLGQAGTVSYYEIMGASAPKTLRIFGEVHLILDNDATLTLQHIKLEAGNTLHIHPQAGDGTVGKITVNNGSYENAAGIGSAYDTDCGDLFIHGGDITATGGEYAAGIGGGGGGNGGEITIYAGTVRATGGTIGGPGIGHGSGASTATVNLYGGEIYASYGSALVPTAIAGSELSFGDMRVYRGTGKDSFAALHTSAPLRAKVCTTNQYVKIVECTEHQFICSTCSRCGKQSDTPQTSKYIDRTWNGSKVVEEEKDIENAINLAEELTLIPAPSGSDSDCDKGGDITGKTYYVSGELDLTDYTLYDNGQVSNIILCDDGELKVHHILAIGEHGKLHFYGQKNDTGKILANEAKTGNGRPDMEGKKTFGHAAIGGGWNAKYVGLYFHGGNILGYGTTDTRNSAIGIHNGYDGNCFMYFYGGTVEGIGVSEHSAGIGGQPNRVYIYGGSVTGRGGDESPGIGGNYQTAGAVYSSTTAVEIHGGEVYAYGGKHGAGIGSFECAVVDIFGGTVTAQGGDDAAGIGSGRGIFSTGINIVKINGGTVTARGGQYGAGIGGGINSPGGEITINGGTVYAYGGVDAAGIGGGEDGNMGVEIRINGGTVYAESTGEDSNGAGIGAGEDGWCGDVKIYGGTVYAKGGSGDGPAIGSNLGGGKGSLRLPDDYMVEAGSDENNIERRFTAAERKDACWWRRYAEIGSCSHQTPTRGSDTSEAASYTIGEDNTHTMNCRYCNVATTEEHNFVENVCDKCGKTFSAGEDMWTITIHQTSAGSLQADGTYVNGTEYHVLKGHTFNIPEIEEIEGVSMQALVMLTDTENAPATVWLTDDEIANQTNFFDPSQPFTPTQDVHFYPRYRFDYTSEWTWPTGADGKFDVNNVQLSLTNPLLDYENIFTLQPDDITKETDKSKDDVKYTATYHYRPQTGVTYTFTDVKHERYFDDVVELFNDQENYWKIRDYEGYITDVKLKDRTFCHDGCWNTIYLPFALSADQLADADCPLHGATIKQLKDAWFEDGTLTLTFNDTTAIKAGMPYIVKWPEGDDVTDPVFKNVTPSSDLNQTFFIKDKDGNRPENEEDLYFGLLFTGSWNPSELTDDIVQTKQLLYMGADSKLYYPTEPMTIGAFQCYFHLYGITADDLEENPVKNVVFNFGDATGITTTNVTNLANEADAWYDLSGRRINSRPTTKGIYIQNGRKMMIK